MQSDTTRSNCTGVSTTNRPAPVVDQGTRIELSSPPPPPPPPARGRTGRPAKLAVPSSERHAAPTWRVADRGEWPDAKMIASTCAWVCRIARPSRPRAAPGDCPEQLACSREKSTGARVFKFSNYAPGGSAGHRPRAGPCGPGNPPPRHVDRAGGALRRPDPHARAVGREANDEEWPASWTWRREVIAQGTPPSHPSRDPRSGRGGRPPRGDFLEGTSAVGPGKLAVEGGAARPYERGRY